MDGWGNDRKSESACQYQMYPKFKNPSSTLFICNKKGYPKIRNKKPDARSMMFPRKSSSTCPTFLWLGVIICLLYLLMFGYTDREKMFVYLSISSVSLDVWIYVFPCFSYSPRSNSQQPRGCTEARFTALLARWQKNRHVGTKKFLGKKNTNTWVIYPPTINLHYVCMYVCVYIKYMYLWKTHKMVRFFLTTVNSRVSPLECHPPSGPHWCSQPLSPGRKHS